MTRYRSSPTCSNCWSSGHTKRSCPEMKKKAATWLKENEHLRGTDEYYEPYYVQEVRGYAEIVKNRKCSWCDEGGHNKRGCPMRKAANSKNIEKNKEFRLEVLKKLENSGYGVGALIEHRSNERLYMIMDMRWENINLRASSETAADSYEYSKRFYKNGMIYPDMVVMDIGTSSKSSVYYPSVVANSNGTSMLHYSADHYNVVSPTVANPPIGWVNDESWAKELF